MKRTLCSLALALTVGLATPGIARAQTEFSDAKLESFIVAAIAVDQKIRHWNSRIEAAQDEAEATQLREQATNEVIDVINKTEGMSVDEYQQIGEAAEADPALASRITEIYNQKTAK